MFFCWAKVLQQEQYWQNVSRHRGTDETVDPEVDKETKLAKLRQQDLKERKRERESTRIPAETHT